MVLQIQIACSNFNHQHLYQVTFFQRTSKPCPHEAHCLETEKRKSKNSQVHRYLVSAWGNLAHGTNPVTVN